MFKRHNFEFCNSAAFYDRLGSVAVYDGWAVVAVYDENTFVTDCDKNTFVADCDKIHSSLIVTRLYHRYLQQK